MTWLRIPFLMPRFPSWSRVRYLWEEMWAPKYSGLGEREIRKIPDDDLVHRVFMYIFSNWITRDRLRHVFDTSKLTPAESAVYHAWEVDCQVNNGGYNQYFFNRGTTHNDSIVEAYTLIGAVAHRALFIEAVKNCPYVTESHLSVRELDAQDEPSEFLEAFSKTYKDNPLNDLDVIYYKLEPSISPLLRSFIRNNPIAFKRR